MLLNILVCRITILATSNGTNHLKLFFHKNTTINSVVGKNLLKEGVQTESCCGFSVKPYSKHLANSSIASYLLYLTCAIAIASCNR